MNIITALPRLFRIAGRTRSRSPRIGLEQPYICQGCRQTRTQRRWQHSQPADDPSFTSIIDHPAKLVRSGRRHGYGLIVLAIIPITAFALGTWQVQRLHWKTDLMARFEDRLVRPPLPLPPRLDPSAVPEFDYRRVLATGTFQHDQEMLVGPRLHDGDDGYLVVTPLERDGKKESTILVCRGWIPKRLKAQKDRAPEALPRGKVTVQGLLREPWKRNFFTPVNRPEKGEFYFPDVGEMAGFVGSQPVWVEETMKPDLIETYRRENLGVPIGRIPEVNLRNNHTQYIFTWYALSLATSIMFWMIVRKPPSDIARRVRQNKEW
ncbi:SURF1-domain-containing protein [Patellaria atrata CBS 101060]|uniref:SURF1-like protein n=1 Tax=Patellaria atrata CBS 101060 TaxID=1346257 RepID=A0A9P4SAA9_9PEZI|nr:SURF1-domain-containing protein [Patellaria atrata CBS 101060]